MADLKDRVKIAWESGDRYEGAWRNENMNGKGTYYYADGNIYEGQWVEGNKHGEGSHTWVDGQIYKGQWVDDTMHGRGKYTFPNGNTYEGQYEAGVRHGKGKFTYANGGVYSGGFAEGKKDGFVSYSPLQPLAAPCSALQRLAAPCSPLQPLTPLKKDGVVRHLGLSYPSPNFNPRPLLWQGTYVDPAGKLVYEGNWEDKEHGFGESIFP